MSEAHLLYRVAARVAYFTINRESHRNALSGEAVSLFLKYLDEAEKDENVHVILISGSGDKAFCSGADLADATQGAEGFRSYARLLKRLAGYSKPVVAKINLLFAGIQDRADQIWIRPALKGKRLEARNTDHRLIQGKGQALD
jgi:enoyl-CoA hydratase/carnithine racemase